MKYEEEKGSDFVSGFAKGLSVIEAFGDDARRMSITDVAQKTGLDRASARRLLLTLVIAFFVLYLLFEHVFPWVDPKLPFNQVELDNGAGQ